MRNREWEERSSTSLFPFPIPYSLFPASLPVPGIRIQPVAAGLAIFTVEDEVVFAVLAGVLVAVVVAVGVFQLRLLGVRALPVRRVAGLFHQVDQLLRRRAVVDRKSTRLNSSH